MRDTVRNLFGYDSEFGAKEGKGMGGDQSMRGDRLTDQGTILCEERACLPPSLEDQTRP